MTVEGGKITRSIEPSGDVVSIPPELHYLLTTYLLLGSIFPAHEPLVMRGILSVPKAGDVESSCEGDVTWVRLGGSCRLPQLCCPIGLGHDVILRLAGRSSGPDKQPSFRGSWYAGVARGSSRSHTLYCPLWQSAPAWAGSICHDHRPPGGRPQLNAWLKRARNSPRGHSLEKISWENSKICWSWLP